MMKLALAVCAAIALLAAPAAADAVVALTEATFDDWVADKELALVEFYAPWCGHCKRLAPEYEKAAGVLAGDDEPIQLAKVDATENSALASRFGVRGYPTLKVFRSGADSAYEGPRESDGIISYMRKQSGPSSKLLQSSEALAAFLQGGDDDVKFVAYFTDDSDALHAAFMAAANSNRDRFSFAHVTDGAVLDAVGYRQKVVAHRRFASEADKVLYTGDASRQALSAWLAEVAVAMVGEMSSGNSERYTALQRPILKLFFAADAKRDPSMIKYWRNRLLATAREQRQRLLVAYADSRAAASELDEFGLRLGKQDVAAVIRDGSAKYVLDGKPTRKSIAAFAADFLAGELTAYLKSAPAPASNDGAVKVVVADTFDEIVNDDSKDVLIEFYAPWCGHCKKLQPKYEELGRKMAKYGSVVVAKMDATANDVPPAYNVRGFPTLYFAPANNKARPLQFSGEREVASMAAYIRQHAAKPLKRRSTKAGKAARREAAKAAFQLADSNADGSLSAKEFKAWFVKHGGASDASD